MFEYEALWHVLLSIRHSRTKSWLTAGGEFFKASTTSPIMVPTVSQELWWVILIFDLYRKVKIYCKVPLRVCVYFALVPLYTVFCFTFNLCWVIPDARYGQTFYEMKKKFIRIVPEFFEKVYFRLNYSPISNVLSCWTTQCFTPNKNIAMISSILQWQFLTERPWNAQFLQWFLNLSRLSWFPAFYSWRVYLVISPARVHRPLCKDPDALCLRWLLRPWNAAILPRVWNVCYNFFWYSWL